MKKIVVLNAGKINYDHALDMSGFDEHACIYEDTSLDEILPRIQDANILVTKEMVLPQSIIEQFPSSIELICEAGTGYNNIDIEAAKKQGIHVCNIPAYSTKRVAHTAMMLILNVSSSMRQQQQMIFQGDHRNFTDHMMVDHVEVNGKILGIIGAGNIGREVIKLAKAFDMEILVYSRTQREDEAHVHYVTLEQLLKESDYVSLHCPLQDNTYHMINKQTLALMKPTAFIINTSRGALIDESALMETLQHKQIAGAGLDVQEIEPMRDDHPFYTMDQVILTPHMGWRGKETRQRLIDMVVDNIQCYLAGQAKHMII